MTAPIDPIGPLSTILTEHGPLAEDDIAERLREAGVTDTDRALRHLRFDFDLPAGQLVDGRWVWLPTVLAGRVFTRRVTESEVSFDLLSISPDLAPIAALCDCAPYQRLADGSAVHYVAPDDDQLLDRLDIPPEVLDAGGALALAAGTFEALGVDDGDLVALRLGAAGLTVERVTSPITTAASTRLTVQLGAAPQRVDTLVWTACLADPALFTEPAAPLSELVAERGLARRGDWLAAPGFDFSRWAFGRKCELLAQRHRLSADDAVVLNTLLRLYHLMPLQPLHESHPPEGGVESATIELIDAIGQLIDDVGHGLGNPLIVEALAAETVRHGRFSADGLRQLADVSEPRVPPSARVACQWLRAVACEREGDVAGCERALLQAVAIDDTWPLPLLDLAEIASDRGDAEAALALLRRAGAAADHPLVFLLRRHRSVQRTDLGRNAACWCGSGRKYKKCHLGGLPLRDRAGWLYHKAIRQVLFGDWTDLRHAAALERCRSYILDDADAFNAALADPVVIDAVLFEGGGFEEFLTVRGALLPADERALAEQWLRTPRSVFEIEHVQPGGCVTVRDARTGERHEVAERSAGYSLQPGQLVCARVLSAGVGLAFIALEPISVQQRDPLIALLKFGADPVELVAQLSGGAETTRSLAR